MEQLLYLSRADVVAVGVAMGDVIAAVEKGFEELGHGRVEMPPKPGVHPGKDNFIHAMPAYIEAAASAGIKWVSGYPGNPQRGLPYISGLLILNDTDTGIPKAVMDCTWITGMRTGAASAVSAKYLARPESAVIGILACGVQGHTNLEAMSVIFPLQKLKAFDVNPAQSQKLAEFARRRLGLEAEVVDDPKSAVSGSDIVVTSGPILKEPHATIEPGWLEEGVFVSCVDFDSYFARAALAEAAKWTTDNLDQYNYYKNEIGFFKDCPTVYAELAELVTGRKKGRETPAEKNFAANLGLAMEDMMVAPLVYQRAVDRQIGTWLTL